MVDIAKEIKQKIESEVQEPNKFLKFKNIFSLFGEIFLLCDVYIFEGREKALQLKRKEMRIMGLLQTKSKKEMIEDLCANLTHVIADQEDYVAENGTNGEVSKLDMFDSRAVLDFYKTIIELEQWDDEFEGNYSYKRRLVKINKYLDIVTATAHKDMLKPHLLRGLFLELEVCLIPNKFISVGKVRKGNHTVPVLIAPRNPEEFGLPGKDEVLWGTIREVDANNCAVISCRGDQKWLKDWITYARSWEYVKVD